MMDWRLKLLQILECFADLESTWYEEDWAKYGISDEEREMIEEAFAQYSEGKTVS